VVRLVAAGIHLSRDLVNIATTNGLDIKHEWGAVGKSKVKAEPALAFSAEDFLFLTDFIEHERANPLDKSHIRTSIIICVHNHASYTFQCLRALFPQIDLNDTEIIVVDNASSDETARLLSKFSGVVTVVMNSDNVGFVKACNQGSALAVGKYLVFLNNDTVVHPGWLGYLIETVESDASIGAVGSMLLQPDGCLQEAGGIVWSDGNAANYGRGAHPGEHRFRFAREVDYCSAAALLVRKDLFSRLGGFDERFVPAYYEDTDLCFGIRSLGFKVVYQPLAQVTHWEGTTAGADIEQGVKRYQAINQIKFAQKWEQVLKTDHIQYESGSIERAADRRTGPRIIVCDNGVPTPDQDSASQRMFLILQSLAKVGRPVFVPVNQAPINEYKSILEQHGIEVVPRLESKPFIADRDCKIAILSRAPVADEMFSSIRRINREVKIVFDSVDIHSLRLAREGAITRDPALAAEAQLRKSQELNLIRRSDQTWCVSEDDKAVFEDEVPTAQIRVIPNIHVLRGRGRRFEDREGLFFIGSFLHRPNRDAIQYFLESIYPLVCRVLPDVNFYVAGSHMTDEIMAYGSETVSMLGHVRDPDQIFKRSRVMIAPLRFGSGMKGKIGHALSYGLPVVTTTIGAEGFRFRNGCEALVADDAEGFAKAVTRAYSDRELWQQLSDNGYRYVQEHLSPPVVSERIAAGLADLLI
jgi:GT2 family glycosyltransferase